MIDGDGARQVPSVDGTDIKTAAQLEAENEPRIERLKQLGYPEELLNAVALQVRVETIVSVFPPNIRAEMERRYEANLGAILDEIYTELTRPKLLTPKQ